MGEKLSLWNGKEDRERAPPVRAVLTHSQIEIFKKIAKIHDLRSGLLPRLKVSVQNLEYRDPCGKRRENKSTPQGEGIPT